MDIERSPELEKLTEESYAAWERGDAQWYSDHLSSQDPIMLGSAPDEEMRGQQVINDATVAALAERDGWGFKSVQRRVLDARQCGDIGWTLTESRWEFEDGSYVPVRGLVIGHREDGTWKLVVGLTAPAVPNDLLSPGSPLLHPAETLASA
jgi:hypothetical protein